MPSRTEIVTFDDQPPPPGESPWVDGARPETGVAVVDPDPAWPERYDELAARIRGALGWRVLDLAHVGSTSVPGLAAKPIIDIDLTVADTDDEPAYVPALEAAGFELRVREPWWFGHRALRAESPACLLHVFGPDSPELVRHRLFRDWLRGNADEREVYARAKREASAAASAAAEHMMQYNARKERVVREIYRRAFVASGLLAP
ncbi:GrpB family protein [Nocardioides pacificus]